MAKKLTQKLIKELKGLVTRDYQNRDGNYLKSNIPNSINDYEFNSGFELTFSFKNTSEKDAIKWVERKLYSYKDYIIKYEARQTGDYHDDWVDVDVIFEKRASKVS